MCQELMYRGLSSPTHKLNRRSKKGRLGARRSFLGVKETGSRSQQTTLLTLFVGIVTLATLSSFHSLYAFSIAARDEQRLVGVYYTDPLWNPPVVPQRQQSPLMHRPRQKHPAPKERNIVLIHVGKAGGMTIRQNLAHSCSLVDLPGSAKKQERLRQKCRDRMNANNSGLSLHTQAVFHNKDYNSTAVKEATTFVITLRNPIDRIHSVYRFSHPQNCDLTKYNNTNSTVEYNRGCRILTEGLLNTQTGHKLFRQCFPSAAMEDFAQSLMIPFRHNQHFQNLTKNQVDECRNMARALVKGKPMEKIVPHAQFNYLYYTALTLWKFPEKEVFGIRTEHVWEDLAAVDKLVGGTGEFINRGMQSHGSEQYLPSSLSNEAHRKLCCVLPREIEIYLDLFDYSDNLDGAAKKEAEDRLRDQCGVSPDTSWKDWEMNCEYLLAESIKQTM